MTFLLTYVTPDGEFCQSIEDRSSLCGKIDFICTNDGYNKNTRIYMIWKDQVTQLHWAYDRKNRFLRIMDKYMNVLEIIDKED